MSVAQCTRERRQTTQELDDSFSRGTCIYRPGGASESPKQSQGTLCTSLLVCMHAACLPACLPAYLLLEYVLLAQARPTMSCIALVIGASLSEPHLGPYSGCGLCHIMVYRTSCSMRMREVYVASSKVSRGKRVESHKGNRRGIVALLNRLNIGRCDEELRIEHGTL